MTVGHGEFINLMSRLTGVGRTGYCKGSSHPIALYRTLGVKVTPVA